MLPSMCEGHSAIHIEQWANDNNKWHRQEPIEADLHCNDEEGWKATCINAPMCIVVASANRIRKCHSCRNSLSRAFHIPDQWWRQYCRNSNGYFGCAEEHDASGSVASLNAWAYFESKYLKQDMTYGWSKINVFTRWVSATNQSAVLLFDMDVSIRKGITSSIESVKTDDLADPFWPYHAITGELVRLQDDAVWGMRNRVREIETKLMPSGKPVPEYRRLHDLARHAIHVTESLEVGIQTLDSILSQHESLRISVLAENGNRASWQNVQHQLLFDKQMISSLRQRSISNEKRLQNEIQLAFHNVAQYDSGVSLVVGKAAQTDSAAMRTISLLTLAFLPPTFICSLFSMSFFNFSADSAWTVSSQFWIYWAFALPTTLVAFVVCYYWQRLFPFQNLIDYDDENNIQLSSRVNSNTLKA